MEAKNLTAETISDIIHLARQQWQGGPTYTVDEIIARFLDCQEGSAPESGVKPEWKPTMSEQQAARVLTMLPMPPKDGSELNNWAVKAIQLLEASMRGTGHVDVLQYTRRVKSIGSLVSTLEGEDGSLREMVLHAYADGGYGIKIKYQKPKVSGSIETSFVLSPEGFNMLRDLVNSTGSFLPMWASYTQHLESELQTKVGLNAAA